MNGTSKYPLLVLLVVCASLVGCDASSDAPGAVAAKPPPVAERVEAAKGVTVAKLANGLTVIIKPTRSAPVVCVRAYVRAGSLYEGRWLGCGLSHLLEHLVAKNAEHDGAPGGQERKTHSRVDEIGGQANAYTTADHTCYHISAAASKTNDCIDLIADWMARPVITSEDFRREHGVVQRELEMGKDDPGRQMWYLHARNMFGAHPASLPVIGHAAPLAGVALGDVLAYHRALYVPQNMVFCVVGDVDAAGVLRRVRRAFAGFDRGRVPNLLLPPVAPVAESRRFTAQNADLKDVMVRMSFQTVPLIHDDLYALDVLSYVLSRGQASRLVERIRRQRKLVTSITTSSWTPAWGRGAFTVSFRAEPDKARDAERAVLQELRAVVEKDASPEELSRAKRQKIADHVYGQQTAESIAGTLATDYLTTGDVGFSGNYTRRIQAVTAGQVRAAAKKYFRFDRLMVSRLEPTAPERRAGGQPTAAGESKAVTFKLPSGLRVILQPHDAVELVSMAFVTEGGLLRETEATNGLGALMAAMATKGTPSRSAEQIARFFARAGGSIAGSCGNNSFYWQATVLDDSFGEALEILADVVQHPTFPRKELDILRPAHLAAIRRINEEWFDELNRFFRARFYTNSPYRMLPLGTEKVVSAATAEQVSAYHRSNVVGGGSVLAIYGNFDAAAARKKIPAMFGDLPARREALPKAPRRKVAPEGERHVLDTNKQIAAIMIAQPGMKLDNLRDRFPLTVLDTIISGYGLPSGWLHDELRGKQLVYAVHSYNWAGLAPGAFVTYAACQPEKGPTVVGIIERNLRRASQYTPTQAEVDRAVNAILTAELLENQSMSELAMSAALDELYGFGYDFRKRLEEHYRKVTPADVARVGRKYLSGGYVVVVAGPAPARPGEAKSQPAGARASQRAYSAEAASAAKAGSTASQSSTGESE